MPEQIVAAAAQIASGRGSLPTEPVLLLGPGDLHPVTFGELNQILAGHKAIVWRSPLDHAKSWMVPDYYSLFGCTTRPPTTVRTTAMSLMAFGSTVCGSLASITKSASFPGVIDPFVDSS
jgi:hypothetical protein